MRDNQFFPLMLFIVSVMIGGSILIGAAAPQCGPLGGANGPEDYSFATLSGQDLCRVEGRKGYELLLADDVLTIRGEAEENYGDIDRTPVFRLGPDLETAYAGRKLLVSFEVKPTQRSGALRFEA